MFSVCHPVQAGSENLYYRKGKPTLQPVSVCLVKWLLYQCMWIHGPSHRATHTRTERHLKGGRGLSAIYVGGTAKAGRESLSFTNILNQHSLINQTSSFLPVAHGVSQLVALAPILWCCPANYGTNLGYLSFIYLFVVMLPQRTKRQE